MSCHADALRSSDRSEAVSPFLFFPCDLTATAASAARSHEPTVGVNLWPTHHSLLYRIQRFNFSYHNTATDGRYHFVVTEIGAVVTNQRLAVYCAFRVDAHGTVEGHRHMSGLNSHRYQSWIEMTIATDGGRLLPMRACESPRFVIHHVSEFVLPRQGLRVQPPCKTRSSRAYAYHSHWYAATCK